MKNIIIIIITTLLFSSCNEEKKIKRKIVKPKKSPISIPIDSVRYYKASLVIKAEDVSSPDFRWNKYIRFKVKVLSIIKSSSDIKVNDTIEIKSSLFIRDIEANHTIRIVDSYMEEGTNKLVGIIYLIRRKPYESKKWHILTNYTIRDF